MLTTEENDLLCRVENQAPMGQLMRRHWIPVCLTEEVPEPDGTPVKARILGEDLVVFRDTNGKVGVMDEYCPHRRASLVFGRNEECGLRCLYHGWKMDVEGNVVEMASEPGASALKDKVKHRAYAVHEWAGWVWSYMGPRNAADNSVPAFEPPPYAPTANVRVSIAKAILPCNWAQVLEGAIDSAHSSSLHSSDFVPARVAAGEANAKQWLRPSTDKSPRLQIQHTAYGFRYAALRRPISNAATHEYVRTTVFVAPFAVLVPPNNLYNVANINVPVDDTHTAFYFIAWGDAATTPATEEWRKFLGQTVGVDLDERYRPKRNVENMFWQDRQAMKAGNFTGIKGFPNQDIAMWVTMGPIADRSQERLGASDQAIVEFRKQMVDAARSFADGAPAIGTGTAQVPQGVCSFQAVMPKTTDWRTIHSAGDIAAAVSAA
jgi:phthalate 4,5-dioxygenase oxygenase subunit